MAEVIFWVDLTLRMRFRRSFRLGMPEPRPRSGERLHELVEETLELLLGGVRELALLADRVEDLGRFGLELGPIGALEARDVADADPVEIAAHAREDHADLLLDGKRAELRLLEKLGQARAARQQALGRGIEIGGELCERRHLAILRELELDAAGDLLHGLDLRRRADAAD